MAYRRDTGAVQLHRDVIYDAIRSKIVAGEFKPGQALAEAELGRRFGASRTPVREALMRLQEEDLIEIIPRRGPVVRALSSQAMQEILVVREALEGLAASMAASRISIATLKALRAEWQEFARTLSDTTLARLSAKTEEFHSKVVEAAGNRTLARLLNSLRGRIRSSRQTYLEALGRHALSRSRALCEEHLQIIDALEAGDVEASERLMKAHIRMIRNELLGNEPHAW